MLKLWRLITPAKPLPSVVPCTSTICPTLNISTPILPPTLRSATSFGLDAEFLQHLPGFHGRLGEVSRQRLFDAARAPLAEGDLHGRIAVLVRRS